MSNYARRPGRILAGVLAGAMALSVTPILGFTGVASAQEVADPIGAGNFCEDVPQTEPFTDVQATDPAFGEIVCLVATEITTGVTATTYEPNSFVTRRQMALFLVRLATEANRLEFGDNINELPAPADTDFSDTEDEEQFIEDAISQITQAEIAEGFPDGTYRPAAPVSRRQMAAFIDRTYEFLTGTALPRSATDHFADDNNDSAEAQASTNAVAEAGIFIGNEDGTFRPAQEITRRQMASVITRTLQVLFENGEIRAWVEEGASASTLPELTTARIVKTVTAAQVSPTNPIGTYVEYTFDENIDLFASTPSLFHVYNADGSLADETGAVEASRSGSSVVIRFPALDTAAEAAPLTLATVDLNAVTDNQNQENPEGDAALGAGSSGGSTNLPAGITNAPDLVSVGNFRQGAQLGETAVDFTFDEVAFNDPAGTYLLVLTDGSVVTCTGPTGATAGGGTIAGGNGTTVHTVICPNPGGTIPTVNGTPLTATNVSRGLSAGISEKAGANNATDDQEQFLQAADVANAGNTPDPDLVSAEFRSADATKDQVLFVFDEAIATAVGTDFAIYKVNDPANTSVGGTAAVINPANRTQVLVDFPDGALTGAVGATTNGVIALDDGTAGAIDEVGVANTLTTPAQASGDTAAPQLVSVALSQPTDAFGNPGNFVATYTFDENVDLATVTDFILYAADGTRYVASACTSGTATTPTDVSDDATVTCTTYTGATSAQVGATTLGTVDDGAVNEKGVSLLANPEGAAFTTGGTGTQAA